MEETQSIKKAKRSIKIYPIFASFTGDMIFFVPIDTLFLTLVKGLTASQITAMTMVSLIICILSQKIILLIVKKIGNVNSLRLGSFMLLIASLCLTFGNSFPLMLLYKTILELAYIFLNMDEIVLKNNLNAVDRSDDYYKIRNKTKIIYSSITLFTALVAGSLFNINNYFPMYLSMGIYIILFGVSFLYYESKTRINVNTQTDNKKLKITNIIFLVILANALFSVSFLYYKAKNKIKETTKSDNNKLKITNIIFLVILANAVFYSIIKMGQNNSKLFMQYDFQNFLSVEMVTYYITAIVFISRIARLLGNIIFGKVYKKIKDKMSIALSICLALAFILLLLGHFINTSFVIKVLLMSLGFFLILAIRDSFQVYIEDVALGIANKDEQQKIIIKIEVSRRIGTLILSTLFTLILMRYELVVVEFVLLILSIIEIFISKQLCNKLTKIKREEVN